MSSLSKRLPAWIAELKTRYFWGMPHTETDILAFRKAMTLRAEAEAAAPGRYAAVKYVEAALDRVTRWSGTLLVADTLLTLLILLLGYRATGDAAPAAYLQLSRWAFMLALAATVILCTNLRLVWASDAMRFYADADESYTLHLNVYKGRAWRYTVAVVLSFGAFACTLAAVTQMK